MSTEAEIAAGRALCTRYSGRGSWDERSAEDRVYWIEWAMDIVRAYQRAAWREPTEEDVRERNPMLVTVSYMHRQDVWSSWRRPIVTDFFDRSNDFTLVRIQDLPPLPEPMETTDAAL